MGHREDYTYSKMRRNVRATVQLPFKNYEIRAKALITVDYKKEPFEVILPLIKLRRLKRWYLRNEVIFELKQIKGVVSADTMLEVFGVYGTQRAPGEYKRYLGELFFFVSNLNNDDTEYRYKDSKVYWQQPEKSSFIEERL